MDKNSLEVQISSFSANIYRRVSEGHDNILFSPYSLYAGLLLADLGAKGLTEKELRAVLGLGELSKYELHDKYREMQNTMRKDKIENVNLNIATRVYLQNGITVDANYLKTVDSYYGNDVGFITKTHSNETKIQTINKWVEGETNGNMKNAFSADNFNHHSFVMSLINAAHFKMMWYEPFPVSQTTTEDFHISKHRKKPVKMMNAVRHARYLKDDNLDCTAVELPFVKRRVRMIFVRPNKRNGLEELETVLTTANELRLLLIGMGKAKHASVAVSLPRFKMEDSGNVAKILPALGIRTMFQEGSSDFSGMIQDHGNTYMSDFIHKACIEVDETDQDGYANIEQVSDDVKSREESEQFVLDRPFMFIVLDIKYGTILFMGRYCQPPAEAQRMCAIS